MAYKLLWMLWFDKKSISSTYINSIGILVGRLKIYWTTTYCSKLFTSALRICIIQIFCNANVCNFYNWKLENCIVPPRDYYSKSSQIFWIFFYVLALNSKLSAKGYERIILEMLRRSGYFNNNSTISLFWEYCDVVPQETNTIANTTKTKKKNILLTILLKDTISLSIPFSNCSPWVLGPVASDTKSSWLTYMPLGGLPLFFIKELYFWIPPPFEPSLRAGPVVGRSCPVRFQYWKKW